MQLFDTKQLCLSEGKSYASKLTRMKLCLKTSEATGQGGVGITSPPKEVYKLTFWPHFFYDINYVHSLKLNLEMRKVLYVL